MHELAQSNNKGSRLEINERPIDHTDTTNRLSAAAIVNTLGPELNIGMLTIDQMNAIHGYYDDLFQKRVELWQTVFDPKAIRPYGLSEIFSTIDEAYRQMNIMKIMNNDPKRWMVSLQNTFARHCANSHHDLVFKGLDVKSYGLDRLLKEEPEEVRKFELVTGSSVHTNHDREGVTYDLTFGTYLEGTPLGQFKCEGMGHNYEYGIVGYNDAQTTTAKTIDGLRRAVRILSGLTESVNEEFSDQLNGAGIRIAADTIPVQEIDYLKEEVSASFYEVETGIEEHRQVRHSGPPGSTSSTRKIKPISTLSTKAISMIDFLKNAAGTDSQK